MIFYKARKRRRRKRERNRKRTGRGRGHNYETGKVTIGHRGQKIDIVADCEGTAVRDRPNSHGPVRNEAISSLEDWPSGRQTQPQQQPYLC